MDTQEFQDYQDKLAAAFLVDSKNLVLRDGPLERSYLQEQGKSKKRLIFYLLGGATFTTYTDLTLFKQRYGHRYNLPRIANIATMSLFCVYTAYTLSLGTQLRVLALDLGVLYEQQLIALNPELEKERPKSLGKLEEIRSPRPESPSSVYEVSGNYDQFTALLIGTTGECRYIRYRGRDNSKIYTI
jgi:hypothetical protein